MKNNTLDEYFNQSWEQLCNEQNENKHLSAYEYFEKQKQKLLSDYNSMKISGLFEEAIINKEGLLISPNK